MTVRVPAAEIEREIDARVAKWSNGEASRVSARQDSGQSGSAVLRQASARRGARRTSFARATRGPIADRSSTRPGGPRSSRLGDAPMASISAIAQRSRSILKSRSAVSRRSRIEKPLVAIADADVEKMIERLRQQRATWRACRPKGECKRPCHRRFYREDRRRDVRGRRRQGRSRRARRRTSRRGLRQGAATASRGRREIGKGQVPEQLWRCDSGREQGGVRDPRQGRRGAGAARH